MKIIISLLFFLSSIMYSQKQFSETLSDQTNYTSIGNIGLTVTNYGVIGSGLKNLTQPIHPPSCEYPMGSGIEHLYLGGLWIGGFKKSSLSGAPVGPFVSTGVIDVITLIRDAGFEFTNTPGANINQRSSLLNSPFYNPSAVSHQDFIMDYEDTSTVLPGGIVIPEHNPLGVAVHQETYSWNFPFANFFVMMNYTIKNISNKYLDSVYVGLYIDPVVRNAKITNTINASFFNHTGMGYDDSLKYAYAFDVDGDPGFTDSYIGVTFLGSTPKLPDVFFHGNDTLTSTSFTAWYFRNVTDPVFFSPQTEQERYMKMQGYFQYGIRYNSGVNPAVLKLPANRAQLITYGYYKNIPPGDSINIVYAVVCAKKYGTDPASLDTELQRTNLKKNAAWAISNYFGNDWNRNGILDADENIFGDGKIHRFTFYPIILTSPNAEEHCLAGYNRNIKWVSHNVNNVKLEFSINNGVDWTTIVSSVPAISGSYSWLVPFTPSESCRLRISDVSNPSINWVSPDVFTISAVNTAPQITWNILSTVPDTSFPVMSFNWNAFDLNGNENLAGIRIALNDTNNFVLLDRDIDLITIKTNNFSDPNPLMDIFSDLNPAHVLPQKLPGLIFNANNILYLQAVDLTGAVSPWISTQSQNSSHLWFIKKPKGKYIIIDDYKTNDNAASWYTDMMDSLQLNSQFDVLDLANQKLPFLDVTSLETIKLFDYLLWYSDNNPSLNLAGVLIPQFTNLGGKAFLSIQFPQSFDLILLSSILPISTDSSGYLSSLLPGRTLSDTSHSGYPQLQTTSTLFRVRSFYFNPSADVIPIYYLSNPGNLLSGYLGFTNNQHNLFFTSFPLNKTNGIPGSIKNLLQKVFFDDFNTPFIRINSPTVGEIVPVGANYRISWNSNQVSNVKIEYSTDNGTSWITIIANTSGSSGSYFWIVPNTPSNNCKIKISDVFNSAIYGMNNFTINPPSAIDDNIISSSYQLQQNYPNPFNPMTKIGFRIKEKGNVKLSIHNILGEEIRVLLNEEKEAGHYSIDFDGSNLPSSVYFYRLKSGNFIDTKKLLLLR